MELTNNGVTTEGPFAKAMQPANDDLEQAIADLNDLTDEIAAFAKAAEAWDSAIITSSNGSPSLRTSRSFPVDVNLISCTTTPGINNINCNSTIINSSKPFCGQADFENNNNNNNFVPKHDAIAPSFYDANHNRCVGLLSCGPPSASDLSTKISRRGSTRDASRRKSFNSANCRTSPTLATTVESSVLLIQNLLAETKQKCAQIVVENTAMANRYDNEFEHCHKNLARLKDDLYYANRCVNDIEVNMMVNGSATESDQEMHSAEQEMEITIWHLREENGRLKHQLHALQTQMIQMRDYPQPRDHNGYHHCHPQSQHHHQDYLIQGVDASNNNNNQIYANLNQVSTTSEIALKINQLQAELAQTTEALTVISEDRSRLKAEKAELLNQMKEVYTTLDGKEKELRDFIRQYEQKMKDSEKGFTELLMEKEQSQAENDRLRKEVLETRNMVSRLQADISTKDGDCFKLQQQLKELQGRFLLLTGKQATPPNEMSSSLTTPSLGYVSNPVSPMTAENGNQSGDDLNGCMSMSRTDNEDVHMDTLPKKLLNNYAASKRELSSSDELQISYSNASGVQPSAAVTTDQANANKLMAVAMATSTPNAKKSKCRNRAEFSSAERTSRLSKFLGLGSSSTKLQTPQKRNDSLDNWNETIYEHPIAADLSLAEKADRLIEARGLPLAEWKQCHVLAWLELELCMCTYSRSFLENVKSGRILMSLTDGEVETALKIVHPLHKRKLRLAIEDYRAPALSKYPQIRDVTCQYVANQLLQCIGLPQYVDNFRVASVDGRLLNQLTRKQLEKYLGVTRKFHQLSLLRAVDLLRKFHFDVKSLAKRRSDCEKENADLLVWSNARFIKWLRSIDLSEYADNLNKSGIHGAVAVLDPSFTAETLATALGISNKQQIVKKHLISEFNSLLINSRSAMNNVTHRGNSASKTPKSDEGGSLPRSFAREVNYPIANNDFVLNSEEHRRSSSRKRPSLRGSFGRVFGLKASRHESSAVDEFVSPVRSATTTELVKSPNAQAKGATISPPMTTSCFVLSSEATMPPANLPCESDANRSKPSAAASSTPEALSNRLLRSKSATGPNSYARAQIKSAQPPLQHIPAMPYERSEHLRTILGSAPQVLMQPPVTSASNLELNKRSSLMLCSGSENLGFSPLHCANGPGTKSAFDLTSSVMSAITSSNAGSNGNSNSNSYNNNTKDSRKSAASDSSADSAICSTVDSSGSSNGNTMPRNANSDSRQISHSVNPSYNSNSSSDNGANKLRPSCGVGASKLRKFAGVLMRDKQPRSPGQPSPGRPHSIAEWSPSHAAASKISNGKCSAGINAKGTESTGYYYYGVSSNRNVAAAAPANSTSNLTTAVQTNEANVENWHSSDESNQMKMASKSTATASSSASATPPPKPARQFATIRESELEAESNDASQLPQTGQSPMRSQVTGNVNHSPGRKDRPNSLPLRSKSASSTTIVSFDMDAKADIIKIDLIETDL